MLSNEAKTSQLTSAGDIVIGQHSPHLTLADWQVGVRVPLAVVWVAVAAVKIDLNLHLTMTLHGWTKNQTQQVGLVQFFLSCSSKVKKTNKTKPSRYLQLLSFSAGEQIVQHSVDMSEAWWGSVGKKIFGSLSKQRGLEVNWPGKVGDWGCAVEPDDWCLSWFRDWEKKGPRAAWKYLKKWPQLKIWPAAWNKL